MHNILLLRGYNKDMKKHVFYYAIFLVGFLFVAGSGVARAVSLPEFSQTSDLPAFISSVYSFALTIVGIAVFIRILYAGFLWLTAAGNTAKAADARDKIKNAVIGAILLFAAYLILYVINPDLVSNAFKFTIPGREQSSIPTSSVLTTDPTSGPVQITGTPQGEVGFRPPSNIINEALAAGIYYFTVEVVDLSGNSCQKTYSIEIFPGANVGMPSDSRTISRGFLNVAHAADNNCGVVNLITDSIPNGTEGIAYYAEIWAEGGQPPYVYSVIEGNLPPGLALTTVGVLVPTVTPTATPVINGSPTPTLTPGPVGTSSPAPVPLGPACMKFQKGEQFICCSGNPGSLPYCPELNPDYGYGCWGRWLQFAFTMVDSCGACSAEKLQAEENCDKPGIVRNCTITYSDGIADECPEQ